MKKRMHLPALCLALLLSGCATGGNSDAPQPDAPPGTTETVDVDGGRTERGDPDAPKTIASTELTGFDCRFSTMILSDSGTLGNHIYHLRAKIENGAVTGEYAVLDGDGETRAFTAGDGFDGGFMGELYDLLARYEIAQFNGYHASTAGLPEDYGAELEAAFASGESIRASDNAECFLPTNFLSELLRLFERGAAETPVVLDFSAATATRSETVPGGWALVSWPVYTLGLRAADGELTVPAGYDALAAAIGKRNEEAEESAAAAFGRFGTPAEYRDLHALTESFVTRADSEVVSFYERTARYEDGGQDHEFTDVRAHNLDARTGRELRFADVFRDMEYLPSLLLMAFESAYPEQAFYPEALDFIRESVENDDGSLCFALGYGCVHVFADEYVLSGEAGGQHVTLSYVLNPGQVRAFYTTEPERWFLPMDYDTTYWRGDVSVGVRLHCYEEPDSDETGWEVTLPGGGAEPYEEQLFGYAPSCWLARTASGYYIYQRVPVGDVSMYTDLYAVEPEGVSRCLQELLELAVQPDTPLDPDHLRVSMNMPVFTQSVVMIPCTAYRVRDNGMPEMLGEVYDLEGPWVRLREGGRYNPDKRENAAVSGGMWTLIAGQEMRPYQTDLHSFLDFITDDGRVVRFAITRFDETMLLDGESTLEEIFEPIG